MARYRSRALSRLEGVHRAWLDETLPDPRGGFLEEEATAPDGSPIREWDLYVLYALNPTRRDEPGPFQTEDLTKVEGYVLRRRLGLGGSPASLEQVGEEVLLVHEQVRRIEAAGVRKLLLRHGERHGDRGADASEGGQP